MPIILSGENGRVECFHGLKLKKRKAIYNTYHGGLEVYYTYEAAFSYQMTDKTAFYILHYADIGCYI